LTIIIKWVTNLNNNVEHLTFDVNQQYIWITHLGMESGLTRFVTKDVYVIVIAKAEIDYVGNILHPNPFYFCKFYYIFNVYNHTHWILENEYLGFFVWQRLSIAL
jgi:hypothetical protein